MKIAMDKNWVYPTHPGMLARHHQDDIKYFLGNPESQKLSLCHWHASGGVPDAKNKPRCIFFKEETI